MALIDAGESIKELGEVKDALDMEVKQNFIDPLQNLHDKDLKEIQVRVYMCLLILLSALLGVSFFDLKCVFIQSSII